MPTEVALLCKEHASCPAMEGSRACLLLHLKHVHSHVTGNGKKSACHFAVAREK